MKAIVVFFDSLSRKYLPPYGNTWVRAPNFERLGQESVTFDNCYVGSMPCMPARRELHSGRHNFLHRDWGPLEPFDDSMPELLSKQGVYTHLVSDHYHYWEDGGATYHNRYNSWEIVRGQEGDKWKGEVADPEIPPHAGTVSRQDWINRKYMAREEDMSQTRTFDLGLEFMEQNHDRDNWFLQIECFDPHPPFMASQRFRDLYQHKYAGPHFDWPKYAARTEDETNEMVEHMRREYAALVSQCDHSLGRITQAMDRYNLWQDTMLIVTCDHGFLLGEHQWWAFVRPPFYDEVAVKPLFIWDPRSGRKNTRSGQLVQTHDLPATLLEYFGAAIPPDMLGHPLRETIAADKPVREAALFGVFGGHVNITDGRYVYMRAPARPDSGPLFNYTLMPSHMRRMFTPAELQEAELDGPFKFTKGCRLLRIPAQPFMNQAHRFGSLLYDLQEDPEQQRPLQDQARIDRMTKHLVALMREHDAPREQYERLGLPVAESAP